MVLTEHTLPDKVLIREIKNGNRKAGSQLIYRYKEAVYSTIFYLVRDECIADDLFQDTFLKAFLHFKNGCYQEKGKCKAWLLRIAHNLCMDYFRKTKKNVRITFEDGSHLTDYIGDKAVSHEKNIIKEEVHNIVRDMIYRLSATQREVVVLRVYGDLSFKEIAETTGVSINTALGRMRYALQNLRKMKPKGNGILR